MPFMTSRPDEAPFWSRPADEVIAALHSSAQEGLDSKTARALLRSAGPNQVADGNQLSAIALFLRQFANPLVLILIFGAFVSLALQDWLDAIIILSIVLGSSLLGFFQEHRASRAIAELKQRLALNASVLRDGAGTAVPVSSLVPGDVILLSAGKLIPADCLVLEAKDFLVSEASLTGESFPVEKQPGIVAAAAAISGRSNAVFMGSSVRSGSAKATEPSSPGIRNDISAVIQNTSTLSAASVLTGSSSMLLRRAPATISSSARPRASMQAPHRRICPLPLSTPAASCAPCCNSHPASSGLPSRQRQHPPSRTL